MIKGGKIKMGNEADVCLGGFYSKPSKMSPEDAEKRFLAAWKRGIGIAGKRFFECEGCESFDEATDRDQIRPKWDDVMEFGGSGSTGETLFLGAMVGFYNDDLCLKVYKDAGHKTPGPRILAGRLDSERVEVLTDLMLNYRGW